MGLVRDEAGTTLLLVKQSAESALVRDPETGESSYRPLSTLEWVSDESPLIAAARALPEPSEPPLSRIADPRALGLVVYLDSKGPQPVTTLLEIDTLCESDLHGATGELRAAGLVEETEVDGWRGYRTTELATDALDRLQD